MARTTFYQKNYIGWPPVPVSEIANPKSGYWRETALAECGKLADEIGVAAYQAWVEAIPEPESWKALFDAAAGRRKVVESGSGSSCSQDTPTI